MNTFIEDDVKIKGPFLVKEYASGNIYIFKCYQEDETIYHCTVFRIIKAVDKTIVFGINTRTWFSKNDDIFSKVDTFEEALEIATLLSVDS